MGLRCGGLREYQTFGRIESIDTTLSEFDRQSVVIKNWIIASEAQAKTPFAVKVPMACAEIAAAACQSRNHLAIESHWRVRSDMESRLRCDRTRRLFVASGDLRRTGFQGDPSARFEPCKFRLLSLPCQLRLACHIDRCSVGSDEQDRNLRGVSLRGVQDLRENFQAPCLLAPAYGSLAGRDTTRRCTPNVARNHRHEPHCQKELQKELQKEPQKKPGCTAMAVQTGRPTEATAEAIAEAIVHERHGR